MGALGLSRKTVEFVRETIVQNYGSNPGFGAYESMTLPWWAIGCIGLGLLTSWTVAAVCLGVGIFALGMSAQLLGRVFGRSG